MVAIVQGLVRVRDLPRHLPTPAEIARHCAEIRNGWTAAEARRRCLPSAPLPWTPPLTHDPTANRRG